MPRPGPYATLLAALLLAGCTAAEDEPAPVAPSQTPVASPTPLAEVDTTEAAVTRAPFCDRVSPTGIEAALGDTAEHHQAWDNGDTPPVTGVDDVGNEYGCAWSRGRTAARAWVFAPPVTRERARQLATADPGTTCRRLAEAPAFGEPGSATSCELDTGGTRVRFAGLVGDAWVTCEIGTGKPDPALVRRTGEWCVTVLAAART